MNHSQRNVYFRLWAAACQVQGWSPKDEALRRDATLTVTGEASTTKLTQRQITVLFEWLRLQADPDNLAKAMPVANPDLSEEADRCRQHLHIIDKMRHADRYIERCAVGLCLAAKVDTYRELSSCALEKLRHTLTTRARERDAAAGQRGPFIPRSEPYHQRPSTVRKRAHAKTAPVKPRPGVAAPSGSVEMMPF